MPSRSWPTSSTRHPRAAGADRRRHQHRLRHSRLPRPRRRRRGRRPCRAGISQARSRAPPLLGAQHGRLGRRWRGAAPNAGHLRAGRAAGARPHRRPAHAKRRRPAPARRQRRRAGTARQYPPRGLPGLPRHVLRAPASRRMLVETNPAFARRGRSRRCPMATPTSSRKTLARFQLPLLSPLRRHPASRTWCFSATACRLPPRGSAAPHGAGRRPAGRRLLADGVFGLSLLPHGGGQRQADRRHQSGQDPRRRYADAQDRRVAPKQVLPVLTRVAASCTYNEYIDQ